MLALALAGVLYSATSLAHGSGFLAVFIAGLVLGDARLPYKGEIERFHSSLATLAEIVVFVALGLTVSFGSLSAGSGSTLRCCCSCSRWSHVRWWSG